MNLNKRIQKMGLVVALGATIMTSAAANAAMVTFAEGDVLIDVNVPGATNFDMTLVGSDFALGTTGGNIAIDFDPSILQVNSTSINTAVFDFSTGPNATEVDNVNGQILFRFSSFNSTPIPTADVTFASINFDAIGLTGSYSSPNPLSFGLSDNRENPNFISSWTYDTGTLATGVYCVKGSGNNGGDPGCSAYPVEQRLEFISTSYAVVPVPAAVWLFGSGLIGLVAVSRRKTA